MLKGDERERRRKFKLEMFMMAMLYVYVTKFTAMSLDMSFQNVTGSFLGRFSYFTAKR